MRSQIQLGDVPSEAGTAIGEVLYAIVPKILTEPDSSIARWEKLGHGKELEAQAGSTPAQIAAGPRLTVHATDLNLQHATRYWIHIWSCDMASNCAMHIGYPVYVDLTPPVKPERVMPDVSAPNGGAYWIYENAIQPAWHNPPATDPWSAPEDPETGPATSVFSVFQLVRGARVPVPQMTNINASIYSNGHVTNLDGVNGDRVAGSCEYVSDCALVAGNDSETSGGTLVNGAQYQVQVSVVNMAGGRASTWSEPITVDFTPPTCASLKLTPMGNDLKDNIIPSCAAGGRCDRGFFGGYNWLGAEAAGVLVDGSACTDDESGIASLQMGVGSKSGTDDLIAPQPVTAGSAPDGTPISFGALGRLSPSTLYYVNVRCSNKAGLAKLCLPAEFRVDTTPPTCYPEIARLNGGGALKVPLSSPLRTSKYLAHLRRQVCTYTGPPKRMLPPRPRNRRRSSHGPRHMMLSSAFRTPLSLSTCSRVLPRSPTSSKRRHRRLSTANGVKASLAASGAITTHQRAWSL